MANPDRPKDEAGAERLDSWKQIAQYLGRDVTTVMRWERERAMPVHRVPGSAKRQTIYAIPMEIDNWLKGRGIGDSGLGAREGLGTGIRGSGLGVSGSGRSVVAGQNPSVTALGGMDAAAEALAHERLLAAPVPRQRRTYLGYLVAAGCVAVVLSVVYILARPTAIPRVLGYHQITNDGRPKENTIVTDGTRIYFTELTPSGWIVAEVPAGGGEVKPLSTFLDHPLIQDLSRTRSEILILDPFGAVQTPRLWAMPLSGSSPRRVGYVFADSAVWTPDGNSIVYAAGHDLFLCNLDGSASRKLASLPGRISGIRWSPDGSLLRILVRRSDRESEQIWEVQADGSNAHPLLPDWHSSNSQMYGQWTPDGKYFVFCSADSSGWNLWALSEKGGILRRRSSSPIKLTAGPLEVAGWVPSPDGNKVFSLEQVQRNEVLRYAQGPRQFVPYLRGVSAQYLDFTRDGQWVAYTSPPDSTLWKSRPDGSQAVQLTLPSMRVELPRWSPDGNWIAFMGVKRSGEPWRVYVIPAEGGECQVVMPSTSGQGAPTWSPDGKRVAFGDLTEAGRAFPGPMTIHIVDLATHTATTLPGSSGLWTARWSPDGRHMAAITTGAKTLKIFDFHTSQWQELATAGSISDLNWSHEGDAVYFVDILPASGPAVYRVRLQDRKVEKIATLMGRNPIRTAWLGLTPDDSVLVSNSVGTSEIYALDMEWP